MMERERLSNLLDDYGDGDPDAFIDAAHQLVHWLKMEIERQKNSSEREKRPSLWDTDSAALLKLLRGLDPRFAANIHRIETNIWGQTNSSITRLITVLEGAVDKGSPWVTDAKKTCMMSVAGFCCAWGLSVEKSKLCGFYELMEIIKPALGVDWDIYKLADIAIPYHRRLLIRGDPDLPKRS